MIRQQKIYEPIIKEYSRLAKAYDSRWSFYIESTIRETVKRLSLQPTDRVLDVGCGTGVLLHRLSETHPAEQLFGVDPVPGMLEVARRRLSPSIGLFEGWADHLPFEAKHFDVVISSNMFHYIHKPVAALREIRRVLRPYGSLVITDWCNDFLTCKVCDLYLRLFNHAHFKTYRERECIRMLKENGYSILGSDRYKINWLWGLMTIRAVKEEA